MIDPDAQRAVLEFKDRLQLMIGKEPVSAFARRIGLQEATVRNWVSGKTMPPIDKAAIIADSLGISMDWLVMGRGDPEAARRPAVQRALELASSGATYYSGQRPTYDVEVTGESEFKLIPRYDIRASAGAGQLVGVENINAEMAFRSEWLRRAAPGASKLALVEAEGDSMEPTLRNGDTLLVNLDISAVEANGIYLVQLEGMLLVKRLQPLVRGGLLIRSDNDAYKDETLDFSELDHLHVVGRVIWYGRQL